MFAGISFAELGWGRALLVAVCGLVITFIMLAILFVVIKMISKIVSVLENRKTKAVSSGEVAGNSSR